MAATVIFCLDSGATTCVVGERQLLHDFVSDSASVRGVGGSTSSGGHGELRLWVVTDSGLSIELSFRRTLWISGGPNLVSIPRLVDGGATFTVTNPECATLTFGPNTVTAPRHGGLYVLLAEPELPHHATESVGNSGAGSWRSDRAMTAAQTRPARTRPSFTGTMQELHSTLGHPSMNSMRIALRNGELDWISSKLQAELRSSSGGTGCEYCSAGKLTRRAHRKSDSPSEVHRFHSDSYGPCPPSQSSKCKYAIVYIHQTTDFWFLFGLPDHTSSTALTAFKTAYQVATNHGHPIRALLSDNGREFTAGEFSEYLTEIGVLRQFSAPGRADQNGKAERAWRTLSERAVTHLAESGLAKSF